MNPSSFASVPTPAQNVKPTSKETLTLGEMEIALAAKNREHGRTSGLTRRLCEDTIRDLEARIKQAQATETVNLCPECWVDTSAVMLFMGRELCPPCARAEEAAYDTAQVAEYEATELGRHDQMSHLRDVLQGMGF